MTGNLNEADLFVDTIIKRMVVLSPNIEVAVNEFVKTPVYDHTYSADEVVDILQNMELRIDSEHYWTIGKLFVAGHMAIRTNKGDEIHGIDVVRDQVEKLRDICDALLNAYSLDDYLMELKIRKEGLHESGINIQENT